MDCCIVFYNTTLLLCFVYFGVNTDYKLLTVGQWVVGLSRVAHHKAKALVITALISRLIGRQTDGWVD